jgi:hypothetical protein
MRMYKAMLMALLLIATLVVMAMASDEKVIITPNNPDQNLPAIGESFQGDINRIVYYPAEQQSKPTPESPKILDAPANDNCINAEPISGNVTASYTTVQATTDGPHDYVTTPNVWFLYTALVTAPIQVTLSDTGSLYETSYTRCALYRGQECPEAVEFPTPVELRGGETIETAVAITSLPAAIISDLSNFQQNYDFSSCSYYAPYGTIRDEVYSYTATSNTMIDLDFEGNVNLSFSPLMVITDPVGTELACTRLGGAERNLRILDFPVTAGETYYIVISNVDGNPLQDDFTLKIYSPNYDFFTYLEETAGVERLVFNAIAGQQYLFEIGAAPASPSYGCEGYLTFVENPVVPENDNCENATQGNVLQYGSTIQLTGDNRGAPTIDCPQICTAPEVWATFETEDTLSIAIDLCGTPEQFHSSYLFLTKDCPCDPYNIIQQSNFFHLELCDPSQLILFFNNIPPGTYWFPICSMFTSEGEYILNIRSLVPQVCSDEVLFGQAPTTTEASVFIESDASITSSVADDFSGLNGPISKITWWGNLAHQNFICNQDSLPISVVFLNSVSGVPNDTVASFDLVASVEPTGYMFNRFIPQRKFVAYLNHPLSLPEGWMMIRGMGGAECTFFWQTSPDGNGNSYTYNTTTHRWTTSSYDFAFCLDVDSTDAIGDGSVKIPAAFELYQNYPNPFNAATSIQFSLKDAGTVNLSVYNITGSLVKTIYNGYLAAGSHNLVWDGTNVSGEIVTSGTYFYRLKDSNGSLIKSMVLLK